jgi:hypothetical protein
MVKRYESGSTDVVFGRSRHVLCSHPCTVEPSLCEFQLTSICEAPIYGIHDIIVYGITIYFTAQEARQSLKLDSRYNPKEPRPELTLTGNHPPDRRYTSTTFP